MVSVCRKPTKYWSRDPRTGTGLNLACHRACEIRRPGLLHRKRMSAVGQLPSSCLKRGGYQVRFWLDGTVPERPQLIGSEENVAEGADAAHQVMLWVLGDRIDSCRRLTFGDLL